MRIKISLRCDECKNRNYFTSKNKSNTRSKIDLKKYCKYCRKHTLHTEDKVK